MNGFYLAFALTVFGMLLYQVAQKSVPADANPFFVIVIAYVVGIALCLMFALFSPGRKGFVETLRGSNWAVFAVGVSAALIELGFLMAYRAGWRISLAAVATNAAAAVVLIPIGLIFYKDQISLPNVIGFILCIVGLVLVVR
jgi:uncharacterized membrane protein